MAHVSQLPIDSDNICMQCKKTPAEPEILTCVTCTTPWHVTCLSTSFIPETLQGTLSFTCPDCNTLSDGAHIAEAPSAGAGGELVGKIRAIEADASLTEREKAMKRQALLSGKGKEKVGMEEEEERESDVFQNFKCAFCMQIPDRPVTTPCGHNFCLKCFQKWIGQGKQSCAKCRRAIPSQMASQPRINSTLVVAIRMAKMSRSISSGGPKNAYHFVHNQDRPDKAYTTDRAKRPGIANAASGRIFVTIPSDYFGPILAENDLERKQGILVGECWDSRMECRQWGVHFPPIGGIAGQSKHGAQSVVLSGGYEDDEDHGEWFLYTGSGGRDLSRNRRTNKEQSFDQKFVKFNQALLVSCKRGYPVRVLRSDKDNRSSYAPEVGYRYDGIYRIEKCWRKDGMQGFKVCRYLFVRCDNNPAPWTSDEHGDRPRCLPFISELEQAIDIFERVESPFWDYDEEETNWKWKKSPPISKKRVLAAKTEDGEGVRREIRKAPNTSNQKKLQKEFSCPLCEKVLNLPLTTPCAHNFCKPCLERAFAGQTYMKERTCQNGRRLRAQKNVKKCPTCSQDISEFLQHPQVNRELMDVIQQLQRKAKEDGNNMGESSKGKAHASEESCNGSEGLKIGAADLAGEGKPGKASKRKRVNGRPPTAQKAKRTSNREKNDAGDGLFDAGGGVKENMISTEKPDGSNELQNDSRMVEEVVDEGNDSPSSPLHLQSKDFQ